MKKATLKIGATICVGVCLAAAIFFINRKVVTATSTGGEAGLPSSAGKLETRCGWFVNPTPNNAWLYDKDGEWTISIQGGYQAKGDWVDFKPNQWVKTNGHYGYGCACLRVTTDRESQTILTIKSSTARPLSVCRRDKKLKSVE